MRHAIHCSVAYDDMFIQDMLALKNDTPEEEGRCVSLFRYQAALVHEAATFIGDARRMLPDVAGIIDGLELQARNDCERVIGAVNSESPALPRRLAGAPPQRHTSLSKDASGRRPARSNRPGPPGSSISREDGLPHGEGEPLGAGLLASRCGSWPERTRGAAVLQRCCNRRRARCRACLPPPPASISIPTSPASRTLPTAATRPAYSPARSAPRPRARGCGARSHSTARCASNAARPARSSCTVRPGCSPTPRLRTSSSRCPSG